MKKTLVALAAVSAVAAFAQTTDGKPGVQIQGLFSGGYQANSYNGVKFSGIDQNGSGTTQVNIRVLEDLGGGMSAYGRLENDFSVMANAANQGVLPTYAASLGVTSGSINTNPVYKTTLGTVGTWGNGELAIGLRSPVGDFAFGALNNAGLTMFVATVSPLQGTSFGGGYGTLIGADPTQTKVRFENSFRFISPTVEGFTGSFIYAAKQTNGTPSAVANGIAATTTSLGMGLNNQVGAQELGLQYANGPLKAAFVTTKTSLNAWCASATGTAATKYPGSGTLDAANSNPCAVAAFTAGAVPDKNQDNKQTGISASYTLANGLLLSAAMQKTQLGGIGSAATGPVSDRTSVLYNAMYTTGAHTMFVQVGNAKEQATNNTVYNGMKSAYSAFGYNYALSKNTALVARYESFDDKAGVLKQMYPSDGPYSQLQGTVTGNTTRVRSMFGIHSAF
jgi:predicted porin